MSAAEAVPLLVASSWFVAAAALVHCRRAPGPAAGLVVAGLGLGCWVLLPGASWTDRVGFVSALTGASFVVLGHPRWDHRHRVELGTALAAGSVVVLAAVRPSTGSIAGLLLVVVLAARVAWALDTMPDRRRALVWLVAGGGSAGLLSGCLSFALDDSGPTAMWAFVPLLALGPVLCAGVRRPGAVDVRVLGVEVGAHLATAVTVLSVFVGVAALLPTGATSALLGGLGLLAALLAAGHAPLLRVLRGVATEVVVGPRLDPISAVGLMTRQIGTDPFDAVSAVREALGLPWVALLVAPPVQVGTRPDGVLRTPLGPGLPDLEVGLRPDTARLSGSDERLLALAVPLLGQSLRLHALTEELRTARGQTVRAREVERLRIRRDLHDGLGPLLTGLGLTIDAARNLTAVDAVRAASLLDEVRGQVGTALDDVRRLVYGMRPPSLDELGLVAAVQQATSATGRAVRIEASGPLRLPAAVEVAAYRIAVEAVANAVRHGPAERVVVRFRCTDDELQVLVEDDGGPSTPWRPGVGLTSMQERAAELGGSLQAGPSDRGGRVCAGLPLTGP